MKLYFLRVLVALDQFINTLFGGHPDETFSASCYRKKGQEWYWLAAFYFVNTLFFWQLKPSHCERAYNSEVDRTHLPKEYR